MSGEPGKSFDSVGLERDGDEMNELHIDTTRQPHQREPDAIPDNHIPDFSTKMSDVM